MNRTRTPFAFVAALALASGALAATAITAGADPNGENKVTVCHATRAETNPYREITVSVNSILHGQGHDAPHEGDVFQIDVPKSEQDWGDIIPAFNGFAGVNDNAAGLAILNNGCVPGTASVSVEKIVAGTGTPVASTAFTITLDCSLDIGSDTVTVIGSKDLSLTGGQESDSFDVQAGAVCSVDEATVSAANFVSTSIPDPVTLADVGGSYRLTV